MVERSEPLRQLLLSLLWLRKQKMSKDSPLVPRTRKVATCLGGSLRLLREELQLGARIKYGVHNKLYQFSTTQCRRFLGTREDGEKCWLSNTYGRRRILDASPTLFGKDFLSCDMMRTAMASPLLLPVTRRPRNLARKGAEHETHKWMIWVVYAGERLHDAEEQGHSCSPR